MDLVTPSALNENAVACNDLSFAEFQPADFKFLRADPLFEAHYLRGDVIVIIEGQHQRLVFANAAACALCGTRDQDALQQAFVTGAHVASRRFNHLAQHLPQRAHGQFERLPFLHLPEVILFSCRTVLVPSGAKLLVVAGVGVRPALLRRPMALTAAIPNEGTDSSPEKAEPVMPPAQEAVLRFNWRSDRDDVLTHISPEFVQAIGCANEDVVGHTWSAIEKRFGLQPEAAIAAALERHTTWSGIKSTWSGVVDKTAAGQVLATVIGGAPIFKPPHEFIGSRGYGVMTWQAPITTPELPLMEMIQSAPAATDDPALLQPAEREVGSPVVVPEEINDPKIVRLHPPARAGNQVVNNEVASIPADQKIAVAQEATVQPARDERVRPGSAPTDLKSLSPAEAKAFLQIAQTLGTHQDTLPPKLEQPRGSDDDASPAKSPAGHIAAPASPPGNGEAVLQRLPIGIAVIFDQNLLFANRALLELLGYPDIAALHEAGGVSRVLMRGTGEALPDDKASGAWSLVNSENLHVPVEGRMQAVDWGATSATLLTFKRVDEARIDTPQVSSNPDLRQARTEARDLHAILDTATDGVIVLDGFGVILSLNKSAEALFGVDQSEVTGQPFTSLIARESQGVATQYLEGLKSDNVARVLNDGREVLGRARKGGAIPIFMTLGRVGNDEAPKFCAVLRDLTQWKKVEGELSDARREAERASAVKSEFLAKISHEIRTPLNAILGFTEVMIEERFGSIGNARYKEYLKDIHASGEHVVSLVNDLLDLSKIEAGKMDLEFVSVDVNRVVIDCIVLLQPIAARAQVVIRRSLASVMPNVVADERALRQIVINILSNAIKFNVSGGQVIVATALTDSGHAVIRVRDTGTGMNDDEIALAMEPFRQLQSEHRNGGTGLGLPITKALVEANRASLVIKSKKNEGTLVEVTFPPTRVLAE